MRRKQETCSNDSGTPRDDAMDKAPLFIVGVPRSGTTLLSRLLGSHPEVTISPETHYFPRHYEETSAALLRSPSEAWSFWDELLDDDYIQAFELTPQERARLRDWWEEHGGPTSHRLILEGLLRTWAKRHQASRWGEKTPRHHEYVPQIKDLFPTAQIIYVVRDPRDVALSLRKVPWGTDNLVQALARWARYEELAQAYTDRWPDTFHEVRYEDILDEPASSLRTLCEAINLPFRETMLTFHKEQPSSFDPEGEPWKKRALGPIDPSNQMKWRDEMSKPDRAIADHLLHDELRRRELPLAEEPMTGPRYLRLAYLKTKAYLQPLFRGRPPGHWAP